MKKKIDGFPVFDFGVPCEVEYYNSNNSWGFGGSRGLKYVFNENLYCKIGRAGTRHMGEFPHVSVWHITESKSYPRVFDETDSLKNRNKAKELIHSLLKETK